MKDLLGSEAMEVADVFAVNKADRDGADATVRDLEGMLALNDTLARSGAKHSGHSAAMMRLVKGAAREGAGWTPEVIKTVRGIGYLYVSG